MPLVCSRASRRSFHTLQSSSAGPNIIRATASSSALDFSSERRLVSSRTCVWISTLMSDAASLRVFFFLGCFPSGCGLRTLRAELFPTRTPAHKRSSRKSPEAAVCGGQEVT